MTVSSEAIAYGRALLEVVEAHLIWTIDFVRCWWVKRETNVDVHRSVETGDAVVAGRCNHVLSECSSEPGSVIILRVHSAFAACV